MELQDLKSLFPKGTHYLTWLVVSVRLHSKGLSLFNLTESLTASAKGFSPGMLAECFNMKSA